jgi:uncharacterized protein YbjT (DUF2867 family)
MSNEKQNILVAGANGTTGRIIIDLLRKSDHYTPIAMVRKQEQKDRFEKENVSTVLGDLEEDLNDVVKNADKVIFAAGSGGNKVKEVDQEGAKRFADAAKNAGAKKFVMLSSMGADNPSVMPELEEYLKAKHNADEHLRASGLNYSIVRPGGLTNDSGIGKIELQEKIGKQGSIARADVAQTLVEALEDNVKQNQTFEIITGEVPIEKAVRTA